MAAPGSYRYLLDTNAVSELVRSPQGAVAKRLARVGEASVCTSVIVACELRYGVAKKGSARLATQLDAVLSLLPVLALEPGVDAVYAAIRNMLERAGTPIGANDLLIAAHAKHLGLTLVTENRREFDRVPGLVVRSWAAATG